MAPDDRPTQVRSPSSGLAALFPGAATSPEFWANIRAGGDAITEVPPGRWPAEDYFDPDPKTPDRTYAHRGGFLPARFPPLEFGIAPTTLEATDTTQLLGLIVADALLADWTGTGPRRSTANASASSSASPRSSWSSPWPPASGIRSG